jgi:hypothetical protein
MAERIINIAATSKSDDECYVLPDGWYYKKTLNIAPNFGATIMTILITDERESRLYNPDNVVYGQLDVEGPYANHYRLLCGAADSNGTMCSLESHKTGPHSWEPYDTEDVKIKRGEHHPEYYQTESGMEPWDVIKTFNLDYWRATAVVYLCRAGSKPGNPEIDDIRKAYTFLGERLRQLDREDQEDKLTAEKAQAHSCTQGPCNEHAGNPDAGLYGAH